MEVGNNKELMEQLLNCGKVTSLELLRADIKNYSMLKQELENHEVSYASAMMVYKERIEQAEEELAKVKPLSLGSESGGIPTPSDIKINKLIEKAEVARQELRTFMLANNSEYYHKRWVLLSRMANVEEVISRLNPKDQAFILDLYVYPIGFKRVMEKYEIENNGDVYRKARNILKKVL